MKPIMTILIVLILFFLATVSAGGEESLPDTVTPIETSTVSGLKTIPGPIVPVPIGGDIGYFSITSIPSGADVIFDGKYLGDTPVVAEVYTTATPSHTISVSKQGYKTWIRTFSQNPAPGETISVAADLEPVVQTGSIHVTSSPPGAIARLDGSETLVTPGTFQYVVPGYHTIEIALSGYFPYSTSVNVAAGGMSSVSALLSPMQTTGSLRVTSSPSGAEVYVDEIYRGYTPMTVGSLSPGMHTVRLHLSGYQEYTRNVEIDSGGQYAFTVTLTPVYSPPTGDIVVSSVPDGAAIYLDGRYRGTTNERNPFDITEVAPGTHTIVLLKSGYQDYSAEVSVSAGKTNTVSVTLNPGYVTPATGEIFVESSPSGADVYLDNVYKGFSPVIIHDVPAGSHVVMLRMNGYQDFQYTIQVTKGQTASVIGGLTPVTPVTQTKSPLSPALAALAVLVGLVPVISRKK